MSSVRVTLAAGIALTLVVAAVVLAGSQPRVLRTTGHDNRYGLALTQSNVTVCQGNEVLPAGVTEIRFAAVAFLGTGVKLAVYQDGHMLTEGSHNPDWAGQSVTVPVTPLNHVASGVQTCAAFGPNSELLQFFGRPASGRTAARYFVGDQLPPEGSAAGGGSLKGRLRIDYLAPSRRSWWSGALSVATNMGFGHFIGGKSVALLTVLLVAAMAILAVRLTLREQP